MLFSVCGVSMLTLILCEVDLDKPSSFSSYSVEWNNGRIVRRSGFGVTIQVSIVVGIKVDEKTIPIDIYMKGRIRESAQFAPMSSN